MTAILLTLIAFTQPAELCTVGGLAETPAVEAQVETRCDFEGRAELEAKLAFLKRAETAFLFSHRSTTDVKARIRAVEQRLASIEEEPEQEDQELPSIEARIQAMEAELAFLKGAEAAFLHSNRSTADVKQRIDAAERCLVALRGGGRRAALDLE